MSPYGSICTNQFVLSMSFYSDVLIFGDLLILGRLKTASPKTSQFLEIVKSSLGVPFHMQTNQSRAYAPTTSCIRLSHYMHHYLPSLSTPGPSTRQLETVPTNKPIQSLLIQPHLFFPIETTIKALVQVFSSLLPPRRPWCVHTWPCVT